MKPIEYDYYQDLKIKVRVGQVLKNLTATITTDHTQERALYNEIPPLMLMWGCVEEDALVCLRDGSLRRMKELRIGEQIRSVDGSHAVVGNIWKGMEEKPCLTLSLEDGSRLMVTGGHPMYTDQGWKKAGDLRQGDRLQTVAGRYLLVVSIEYVQYEKYVYNLSLESDGDSETHVFFANGIAVGDMEQQNRM